MTTLRSEGAPLTMLARKRQLQLKVNLHDNPFCQERQLLDKASLCQRNRNPRRRIGGKPEHRAYLKNCSVHATSPRDDDHLYKNLNSSGRAFLSALEKHTSTVPVRVSLQDPIDEFATLNRTFRSSLRRRGIAAGALSSATRGGHKISTRNSNSSNFYGRRIPSSTVFNEVVENSMLEFDGDQDGTSSSRGKKNLFRSSSFSKGRRGGRRSRGKSSSSSSSLSLSSSMAERHRAPGAPVSFGHRPSTASRVFDPLSMTVNRPPKKKRTLPTVGILSAKQLQELLHAGGEGGDGGPHGLGSKRHEYQPTRLQNGMNQNSLQLNEGVAEQPSYVSVQSSIGDRYHESGGTTFGYGSNSYLSSSSTRMQEGEEVIEAPSWIGGHFVVGTGRSMFELQDPDIKDPFGDTKNISLTRKSTRKQDSEASGRKKKWMNVSQSGPSMRTGTGLTDVRIRPKIRRYGASHQTTKDKIAKYRILAGGAIGEQRQEEKDLAARLQKVYKDRTYLRSSAIHSITPRGPRHNMTEIFQEIAVREAIEEDRKRQEENQVDGGRYEGDSEVEGDTVATLHIHSRGGSSRRGKAGMGGNSMKPSSSSSAASSLDFRMDSPLSPVAAIPRVGGTSESVRGAFGGTIMMGGTFVGGRGASQGESSHANSSSPSDALSSFQSVSISQRPVTRESSRGRDHV